MRVRISYDAFRFQRVGGVTRYLTELHRGLLARQVDSRILAILHHNSYLDGEPGVLGLDVDRLRPTRARQALTKVVDRAFERVWAPGQGRDTIYHKGYVDLHVPRGPLLAMTVYDLIQDRYPDEASPRDVTLRSLGPWSRAADLIFAISDHTRDDLIDRYRVDPDRVVVTPLGVRPVEPMPGPTDRDGAPFVLYVGNRASYHKNFTPFAAAFARSAARRDHRLVCFGGGPLSPAEITMLRDLGYRSDDVAVVDGGDDRLAAAYRDAKAFVYPSRYEGFGLPPLEAMTNGCPVAAARVASIPAVVGDAAVLVDPDDLDEMAHAIDTVVSDDGERARLAIAGRHRSGTFTWDRTDDETLAGYRRLIGG
jgi:glycosyltransferase involved in cell wall biosynthesis